MPRQNRRQYIINYNVQGSLLARVAMYWVYCLIAVLLTSSCWMVLFNRPASSGEFLGRLAFHTAPVLLGTLLLLPIVLVDCLRFSNRFVGPLFRLSRAMDRLGDGERVHNIEFRQGDFWFHIAQSFNRLNERVIRLEQQQKALERNSEEATADVL
jgi:hypothetical protein